MPRGKISFGVHLPVPASINTSLSWVTRCHGKHYHECPRASKARTACQAELAAAIRQWSMVSRFPPLAGSSCLTWHRGLSNLSHAFMRLRLSVRFSRDATISQQRRSGFSQPELSQEDILHPCPLASPSLPRTTGWRSCSTRRQLFHSTLPPSAQSTCRKSRLTQLLRTHLPQM